MIDWQELTISSNRTIKEAMRVLDETAMRIVLIIDCHCKLLGTVTDGDIRRALLKGVSLNDSIDIVMNRRPLVAFSDFSKSRLHNLMISRDILVVPIVDDKHCLIGIEMIDSILKVDNENCDVVLLAGGFGKRLHPLTENCPKPLLNLGSKPIIECIIDDFISQGFKNFYIATHYKSSQIKDYFGNGDRMGCSIQYIEEEKPLGTAGCLAYLPDSVTENIVVMNADIVTKINFKAFLNFHQEHNKLMTMAIREHVLQSQYGVVNYNYPYVSSIVEKPQYKNFVNAGIYLLNKSILKMISINQHLDMTTLISSLLNEGQNVVAFPLHEYWLDVGRLEDYEKAISDIC